MPRRPAIHPLRRLLTERGLSYRAAAKELGCWFTTLQQLCTYATQPKPDLAKRIVKWSGGKVTLDQLYQ